MHNRHNNISQRIGLLKWAGVLALALWPASHALAVAYDSNDFLIAGYESGTIGVYDHDLTFKGNFAYTNDFLGQNAAYWFKEVSAMDFDEDGNLFAAGRRGSTFAWLTPDAEVVDPESFRSLWQSTATQNMVSLNIRDGVGGFGPRFVGGFRGYVREYAGANTSPEREFTDDGVNWTGVAILPNNVLWASTGFSFGQTSEFGEIWVFNLLTGDQTGQIRLDSRPDQTGVVLTTSMFYSELTDTVLTANTVYEPGGPIAEIIERNIDGSILRVFESAPGFTSEEVLGVTRGPNGNVFATNPNDDGVYRWSADGTFLGFTNLSSSIDEPRTILWAGNTALAGIIPPAVTIPEPTPLVLLAAFAPLLLLSRRRPSTTAL